MKTFRASADPLAMACPASTRGPSEETPLVELFAEAAGFGTAVHAVAGEIVKADGQWPDFGERAAKLGYKDAQQDEFISCCAAAGRFWREYGAHFPNPCVEDAFRVERDGAVYTGHPDVWSATELPDGSRTIRVLDWKTTRLADVDYRPQMMRYLWLALSDLDPAASYQYVIAYLRDRTVEISPTFHGEDLIAYHANFLREVVEPADAPYRPGPHCTFCRRLSDCPAHSALVRKTALDLGTIAISGLPAEPAAIVDLYERVAAVAGLCERFQDYARAAVAAAGGRLVGADGVDLALVRSVRAEIEPQPAWPILAERLSVAELAKCVKIRKGELLGLYATKAPPKMKGKFKVALMADLRAAKAVKETEIMSLRAVRSTSNEKALPEGDDNGEAS